MSSNEHTADDPIDARNGNLINLAEDTVSPARPMSSAGCSTTRNSFQSHGRALSMATETTPTVRSNRFSIQFPIQPTGVYALPRSSISPVREQIQIAPEPPQALGTSSDGNYLHLIAASERRVLELKEELQRAEADLNKLKRDWARHEATKKREDARRTTRLEPLQTSLPATNPGDDIDGSSAWMQQEMERRKALMSASKTSNRTVFPGQRHTRALSLLSPRGDSTGAGSSTPRLPPRKESLQNPVRQSAEYTEPNRPVMKPRSSTTSDMANSALPDQVDPSQQQVLDHDALLRAGRKYATDFKDGLWTFWEDIRQATVGEEATAIQSPRKKSSTQTLKGMKKQGSRGSLKDSSRSSSTVGKSQPSKKKPAALPDLADPSFWTDHGIPAPPPPSSTKKSTTNKEHSHTESVDTAASSDAWDTWDDSPVQSRSSSSVTSENTTLPSTVSGSPRPSMSANRDSRDLSKKDAIPWPALKKSGLGSLRRTASHLLSEWEKSLTPSPGKEWTGEEDYIGAAGIGASAEAAAYGANKGKHD